MDRADLSNLVNGEQAVANRDGTGSGLWPPVLMRLLNTPSVTYAAVWNVANNDELSVDDQTEPSLVAEVGQANSQLFWAQRVDCWLAAQRELGSIPLVSRRGSEGPDTLVMSFLVLAKDAQRIGLELQFGDGVTADGGWEFIKRAAGELSNLGWRLTEALPTSAAPNSLALDQEPQNSPWVWTGAGSDAVSQESGEKHATPGEANGQPRVPIADLNHGKVTAPPWRIRLQPIPKITSLLRIQGPPMSFNN